VSDLSALTEYKDITDFPAQHYLQINNCGMRSEIRQGMTIYRPRGRRDHYLLYLQSGKVLIHREEDMVPLKEGSCLYYPPHTPHLYTFADDRPASYYYVHFAGEAADESMAMVSPRADSLYEIRDRTVFENLFHRLRMVYDTHHVYGERKRPMAFPEINGVLLELIDSLIRSSKPAEKRSPGEIMLASAYILEHYTEEIDLEQCAANAHMSLSRFSHLFTERMGVSPRRFILQLRIDNAKELLLYSSLNISQIAESVGFSDPPYFSRLFSKYTGMSPQRYRKERRERRG